MSNFPGYPPKKPRPKRQGDESGTESVEGTEISSISAMSRVTPVFHFMSDDEQIETPKKQMKIKEAPSTQGFIKNLVQQNQRASLEHGLFGSLYSFGGEINNDGDDNFFRIATADHQYNSYQPTFGQDEPFCFDEENGSQQQIIPVQIRKVQQSLMKKTSSLYNRNQFEKNQKSQKVEQTLSDAHPISFIESRVAQINLDNLKLIQQSIISSENQNKTGNKQHIEGSFFKNKPFQKLKQENERKNNFLRNDELEKVKKEEQNIEKIEDKINKPVRKPLFTAFNSNNKKKPNESLSIQCFSTNLLPIEDYQQNLSEISAKPYEYYSEAIQPSLYLETKFNESQKIKIPDEKPLLFGKKNRNIDVKKGLQDLQKEKKPFDSKQKSQKASFNKFDQVKGQPELKRRDLKVIDERKKEDNSNMKSHKIHFLRQNEHGRVKITKIQTKEETKGSNKVHEQNCIEKKTLQRSLFGFERRKDKQSKASKYSNFSMNSGNSDMGLDMKGILKKVNQPKQNIKKINIDGSSVDHDQKAKCIFDFKNRNRLPGLKKTKIQEEKPDNCQTQKSKKSIQNQIKNVRRPRFNQQSEHDSISKILNASISKQTSKSPKDRDQTLTIQKEKPKQNSTIPKYIFSKKTPPKNTFKNQTEAEKKQLNLLNTPRSIEFQDQRAEVSTEMPKKLFESRKKFTVESVTRSNYMIARQRQGFKEETQIQKMKHRNRRADTSDYPSLAAHSSSRSDLIKEVENLIELADIAKRRMRKKNHESQQFLHQTMVLKKKVEEMFPEDRIKRLMDWKYV